MIVGFDRQREEVWYDIDRDLVHEKHEAKPQRCVAQGGDEVRG